MALTDKLSAIGDAIREKTGGTAKLTLDQMPVEIAAITTGGGGGGDFPSEITIPNIFNGNSANVFTYKNNLNWFIDLKMPIKFLVYDPGFQFSDTSIYLVDASHLTFILYGGGCWQSFFTNSQSMINMPKVYFAKQGTSYALQNHFAASLYLRDIPEDYFYVKDENGVADLNTPILGNNAPASRWNFTNLFSSCYSLRNLPKLPFYTPDGVTRTQFTNMFNNCSSLDKVEDFLVPLNLDVQSCLNNMLYRCYRLKDFTFTTDNGVPIVVNWKSQVIDLSNYVGYAYDVKAITNYNSGITADKQVKDDATYQALKNDPDWYTANVAYSRYNHDSAVATINSLPDTSAYLATQASGTTNTIKFKGASGTNTDGGAISNLTEEEIAVATAKGWTVSLV